MKKERIIGFIVVLFAVFFISIMSAHAALELRGTDNLGYRLIYDTDLNITWYDFTNASNIQPNQMNWASALSVNFGGNIYDDWRLPIVFDHSCTGPNCTNSEMGHLYYTELGNSAATWPANGLINTSPFLNLQPKNYWTGTYEYPEWDICYGFRMQIGTQLGDDCSISNKLAIAVRSGDVAPPVVPEPISSILFVTGGTLLAGRRYLRKKKKA